MKVIEQLHNCAAGRSKAYGWSQGEPEEFITILEMPPIKSAHDAVKVALAYQIKKARA